MEETTIVSTIESIDIELVTLKSAEGESKKSNPAILRI